MILVQARSTSSRFPRKHLAPLCGSTALDILISRIRGVAPFAFLIPLGDDLMSEELFKRDVLIFSGPEHDVLGRYAAAMANWNLDWCIRITGDCPLISPQDISWMVNVCTASRFDYGSNFGQVQTDGMEVEYLSRRLVHWLDVHTIAMREHVTMAAREQRKFLEINGYSFYDAPVQYGWHGAGKLSIDTPEDLERVEMVMRKMGAI